MFINKINQPKKFKKVIGNILLNQKIISDVGNYLCYSYLKYSLLEKLKIYH